MRLRSRRARARGYLLILKEALSNALSKGVAINGRVRTLGFIGGATSRRVRILLEPGASPALNLNAWRGSFCYAKAPSR